MKTPDMGLKSIKDYIEDLIKRAAENQKPEELAPQPVLEFKPQRT
jgi:hypothetical protein